MNDRFASNQLARSPDFLQRCAELVSLLPCAADGSEVAALLAHAAALLGAETAAFASFMKDDESYESYRFILACDAAWCLEYESGACFMHDPWLDYARQHSEPMLAANIRAKTKRELEVVALAERYGFASAVIVPAQAPKGLSRLGALCLGSTEPNHFTGEAFSVVAFAATPLAMRLHEWQIAQLGKELMDSAPLSETDMDLLRHERQGHGSKQIAAELKMNPLSFDSRWQRLNARLGVTSRFAAASKAAEYGLI